MKSLFFCFVLLMLPAFAILQTRMHHFDPYNYGAKADGITLDTKAVQRAIDECHQKGGGTVLFYQGIYRSGTLDLKSNVTLRIEAGAVLKASDNLENFPIHSSNYPSYTGDTVTNKMLIYSEDSENISIEGRGTIDGNGDYWVDGPYGSPSFSIRPRIIHFRNCENISIKGVTLYNSASWVQSYQSCRNLVVDGITVDSRENNDIEKERFVDAQGRNTDGLDLIDCEKVRISNCNIDSGDDGIVLKSFSPNEACRDIVISNCIVSSNASGIKIGTETSGIIEDILIQNCVVYDTRMAGLGIMTVDGAKIRRVTVSGISLRNIKGAAIFLRLGARNRIYRKNAMINVPELRDILIENVQGTKISAEYGCSITGVPDHIIRNISLKNINLTYEGGLHSQDAGDIIDEKLKSYPSGNMFGVLPAYGFFVKHVKNIDIENVKLQFDKPDERPAILAHKVSGFKLKNFSGMGVETSVALINLKNSQNVLISDSSPVNDIPVFLSVEGKESKNIILLNNEIKNVEIPCEEDEKCVIELGNY